MNNRKHARRAGFRSRAALILLLFCVCAAGALAAYMLIGTGQKRITDRTSSDLTRLAQSRASAIVSWYGGVESTLAALARLDVLKLFIEGVSALDGGAAALFGDAGVRSMPDADDEISGLRRQLPALRELLAGQLSPSTEELTLLTPDMTVLVRAGLRADKRNEGHAQESDPAARTAAEAALRDKSIHVSPARISPRGDAVLTIALPIQGYMEDEGSAPAGLLIATLRLERAVALAAAPHGDSALAACLLLLSPLENAPDKGFALDLLERDSITALPGWRADAGGDMPFAARALHEGERVFCVSAKVPELPLAVGMYVPESGVLQEIRDHRNDVLLWAVILTLGASALTGLLWWRLVGRHAEAASRELENLHQKVTQQHEFIANITEALGDGLVVQNSLGRILYANSSFGRILGRAVPDLMDNPPESALLSAGGEAFDTRWRDVLRDGRPITFTRELSSSAPDLSEQNGSRHFQIASEPFYDENGSVTGVVSLCRDITDMILAQERQRAMLWKTVSALSTSIEVVDPYLRGHSEHTGELALHMASLLNWDETRRATLRIAASLSQLGMLRLPRGLATKTGRLTDKERALLQSHVQYAKEMLEGMDFGLPVAEVITQMHERMDGSGYPAGLKGDSIREEARLLAVANTFCALLRPRSYRQACDREDALRILARESAKYDGRFVEILHAFLSGEEGRSFTAKLCAQPAMRYVIPGED